VVRRLGCLGRGSRVVVRERQVREESLRVLVRCFRIRCHHLYYHYIHITSYIKPHRPTSRRRRPHLLHDIRLGLDITDLTTLPTLPRLLICLELLHRLLNLRPQIRAMETLLMHLGPTVLTEPHQAIQAPLRSRLLNNHSHRVRESYRVMRDVPWQQEELAFVDVDVFELVCGRLDGFEQHAAFVLVEEFGGRVEVVVCAGIGAADDHDGHGVVVD
jgi:hypothetical protein